MSAAAFKLDVPAALNLKGGIGLSLLEIILVFLLVDLFDNVGTLVAVTKRAGLTAPDGSIPRLNRILIVDSLAMTVGALSGTSPVTSYIESAAGVAVGGRTGLTSVVVGILFLCTLFFAPLVQAIPTAATAPALILVGGMMMGALAEVDWIDPLEAIPAFLTVIMIPLSYSIANGLAFGIISHAVLKLVRGKATLRDWLVYLLSALFHRTLHLSGLKQIIRLELAREHQVIAARRDSLYEVIAVKGYVVHEIMPAGRDCKSRT